jgi:hypothetical protein
MNHPCERQEVIDIMKDDLKEVKHDVKLLLADKYKMQGVSITIIFVISSAVALLAKLL